MNTSTLVSRVWSGCTTLLDDGVSYGGYLEQLTYLIFLKMAHEYSEPPYSRDVGISVKYNWRALTSKKGGPCTEMRHDQRYSRGTYISFGHLRISTLNY